MIEKKTGRPLSVDRAMLPALYPTHAHPPQFWEQLGRTVATFGFLEEVLKKAYFAFTATRKYDAHELEDAYKAWLPKLEEALTATLDRLAVLYGEAVRNNPDSTIENVGELVDAIKEAGKVRNVLCHGSWRLPDDEVKSLPFFVRNKRNPEAFESRIDIPFLLKVQDHVKNLACDVVDSVTQMGWQFPGGSGPGETFWP